MMSDGMLLRDLFVGALRRHANRRAVTAGGESHSYAELESASRSLAGSLMSRGAGPGVPIAIALRNSYEYVVADLAIALLGATKVPINLMLSDDEISYILRDSGALLCLVEPERVAAVDAAKSEGATVQQIVRAPGEGSDWDAAFAWPELEQLPECGGDERGLIMYTGGTTGRPKGVVHVQRGLVMNLYSHLIETEMLAEDVLLVTSPLPHSSGFLLQTALVKGASVIVEEGFDLETVLARIETDRVSCVFMVPTMIYRLLDAVEARPGFDPSSLRTIIYGAAPITVDRLEQGLRLFGPVFLQLYAQSEAPNFLTRLRRDDHALGEGSHRLRSCGQSVVMAEVKTVRPDGTACDSGEIGEVIARCPYTMVGYLGLQEATDEALRDGWLYTGDLGYLDEDGYLYLADRKKDMIISGGLNVYSSEVEQAMARIDGVGQVAVVGMPHPDWGEAVVAFVVPGSPGLAERDVIEASRGVLSSYKRPKAVVLVDELPTTAVGKIDKKRLRGDWKSW